MDGPLTSFFSLIKDSELHQSQNHLSNGQRESLLDRFFSTLLPFIFKKEMFANHRGQFFCQANTPNRKMVPMVDLVYIYLLEQ
jgi:hypothetical protein